MMLQISPQWLLGIPGAILFVISQAVNMMILFSGNIHIGQTTFSYNSFVYLNFISVIGTQMLLCYLILYRFGSQSKLLRKSEVSEKLIERLNSEMTTVAGFAIAMIGMLILVSGVWHWAKTDFGTLAPYQLTIVGSLGGTLIVLGAELTLVSIILGIGKYFKKAEVAVIDLSRNHIEKKSA